MNDTRRSLDHDFDAFSAVEDLLSQIVRGANGRGSGPVGQGSGNDDQSQRRVGRREGEEPNEEELTDLVPKRRQ